MAEMRVEARGEAKPDATPVGPASRVLVVDDEPDILSSLHDLLEATLDAEVVTARSGPEALEIVKRTAVDLVLSDYKMPGMDGIEFLARMHSRAPDVPRVLITAFPDQHVAIQAINEAHVESFLTKPFDAGQVVRISHALLAARRLAKASPAAPSAS